MIFVTSANLVLVLIFSFYSYLTIFYDIYKTELLIWLVMTEIGYYSYNIRSYHIDSSSRLHVHHLLNFLQDAAHQHADGLGFGQSQLSKINLFWVLSPLSIEISELPGQGDEIELSTWVKSIRGSVSEREFSISTNGKLLVNASSLWFCISGETHKPAQVPKEYVTKMTVNNLFATKLGAIKVELPQQDAKSSTGKVVRAEFSDIDMVDHVNNATYARWILDEIPTDYHQNKGLKKLTINYLGEVFLDDNIRVVHKFWGSNNLLHEIISIKTNDIICLAITTWN